MTNDDALWTPLALVAPLGARVSGGLPARCVTGVSIDTRTLQDGDLFVALKGDNSDGHDYVRKAFEAGAAAVQIYSGLIYRGPALIGTCVEALRAARGEGA